MDKSPTWEVIVIGSGPAGMMAASQAAAHGARVLLVEKNKTLGKKLLITGGGRCNVTNAENNIRTLLSKYRDAEDFLYSPFSRFDNEDAIWFFNERGVETKVENEGRVFPVSNKAESIWHVLVEEMKKNNVHILSETSVLGFVTDGNAILGVTTGSGEIRAASFILATGGKSRPETGSTGDGFAWLRAIGHTVREPEASLVPVTVEDAWVHVLSGKALADIKISLFQDDKKLASKKGKILFTHFGASGPTILNMSKDIREYLRYGDVHISLDLLPQSDYSALNDALQELFKKDDKKKFKNALSELIPSFMVPAVIELSKIDPDKNCNSISREERLALIKLLKDLRMKATGLLGEDKAIVTSGGVDLKEIDFKTMQSKLFPNLYLVGDILDIDRPSGGYSLQLCWTTGFVAGTTAQGSLKP